MLGDARSGRLVFVSHCILNQNSVVRELAVAPGVLFPVVRLLWEMGFGIVQLPCPETGYAGLRRFWYTREQYDNAGFRRYCRRIAEEAAELAEEYERNSLRVVAVIGIRGSPSCGVTKTISGWHGGDPSKAGEFKLVEGRGVFMEVLEEVFRSRGLKPIMLDVDVRSLEESVKELREALGGSRA